MSVPPNFAQLRIGETFHAAVLGFDQDDSTGILTDKAWDYDLSGSPMGDQIFTVHATTGLVTPLRPGTDTIRLTAKNVLGDTVMYSQVATVLDATHFEFLITPSGPDTDFIRIEDDGTLVFEPFQDTPALSANVVSTATDARGAGGPAYTLTAISFPSGAVFTITDETGSAALNTTISANSGGDGTAQITAKNASGVVISGAFDVRVLTVARVTFVPIT
jgi:hypothetical protein